MKLVDLLDEKFIAAGLKAAEKEEAIIELINLFENDSRVKDLNKVKKAVLEREKIMSTGVGKGFAIPHGKTNSVNEVIAAFGKTAEPIDYQALDNKPVQLIFLLVGKESQVSTHIKLLSRISRLMNSDEFREKLIKAKTSKQILQIFTEEEKKYLDI